MFVHSKSIVVTCMSSLLFLISVEARADEMEEVVVTGYRIAYDVGGGFLTYTHGAWFSDFGGQAAYDELASEVDPRCEALGFDGNINNFENTVLYTSVAACLGGVAAAVAASPPTASLVAHAGVAACAALAGDIVISYCTN